MSAAVVASLFAFEAQRIAVLDREKHRCLEVAVSENSVWCLYVVQVSYLGKIAPDFHGAFMAGSGRFNPSGAFPVAGRWNGFPYSVKPGT